MKIAWVSSPGLRCIAFMRSGLMARFPGGKIGLALR